MSPYTCFPCVRSEQRRQKKVTKEKATPSLRPLRVAKGRPASGRLRGAPQNSLRAVGATFRQPRRARQRSMRARAPMLTPQPPRRRRSQQGWDSRTSNSRTAPRAIASLGPGCAARGACARERGPSAAQRSNGPNGCSLSKPLCMRRGAQWAGWHVCRRTHMHRGLARRSCLNVAPKARSEFCGAPRPRAPQVAPARSAGDADSGVALSLVTFFRRRERKLLACRATPGLRPEHKHAFQTSTPRLRQAQPELMVGRPGFDTLSLIGRRESSDTIEKIATNA